MSRTLYLLKEKFINASPTILSIVASAGVIGTAITSIKAAPELEKRKDEAKKDMLDPVETFIYVAPALKKPVLFASGTIMCIFGANTLNKRQQASLMSALMLLDKTYNEHKAKVIEMLGEDAAKEIEADIAKDNIKDCDIEIDSESNELLFYDTYGKRYFNRTMEQVIEAEYHFNRNFILRGFADLNEFYGFLLLDRTDLGSKLGWSLDAGFTFYGYQWVDFVHHKTVTDDGLECYIIYYPFEPTADYLDI